MTVDVRVRKRILKLLMWVDVVLETLGQALVAHSASLSEIASLQRSCRVSELPQSCESRAKRGNVQCGRSGGRSGRRHAVRDCASRVALACARRAALAQDSLRSPVRRTAAYPGGVHQYP